MVSPPRRTLALTLAVAAATAPRAAADNPTVHEARRLMEVDVRFDRAQSVLNDALHAGDNGPDDVATIYELAGIAAIVLGERDVGELFFRRLLALEPSARLPADSSPRLLEPFTTAQAHMAAAGALHIAVHAPDAHRVVVDVVSDPLRMIAGARLRYRDRAGAIASVSVATGAPMTLAVPAEATPLEVAIVDEYGNRLHEEPAPAPAAATPLPPGAPAGAVDTAASSSTTSIWRRPTVWLIAGAASVAVGVGFGLDARGQQQRLDEILAAPGDHFYGDAEAARTRGQRDAVIADVAFAAAGALAITAAVMWATRGDAPPSPIAAAPWLPPGGGGGLVLVGDLP